MTVYANLVDGEVKGVYDLIPKFWNGINNFDIVAKNNEETMKENGFVKIVRHNPEYNSETHNLSEFPTYTVVDGEVIEHREVSLKPVVTDEMRINQAQQRKEFMLKNVGERITRAEKLVEKGISQHEDINKLNSFKTAITNLSISTIEDLNNLTCPVFSDY